MDSVSGFAIYTALQGLGVTGTAAVFVSADIVHADGFRDVVSEEFRYRIANFSSL